MKLLIFHLKHKGDLYITDNLWNSSEVMVSLGKFKGARMLRAANYLVSRASGNSSFANRGHVIEKKFDTTIVETEEFSTQFSRFLTVFSPNILAVGTLGFLVYYSSTFLEKTNNLSKKVEIKTKKIELETASIKEETFVLKEQTAAIEEENARLKLAIQTMKRIK
jgi:hypothetical protein